MRVYVYPGDLAGCGYYRLTWPARELQKQGCDVRLIHPDHNKLSGHMDENDTLVGINIPSDADVIVFQRVTSEKMINGIRIMRAAGIAVVIDVDDDMSSIHPNNPAFTPLLPGGNQPEYSWNNALRVTEAATLVTTSTDALIDRYARHGRGVVLRNCVPEIYLKIQHRPEPKTIGWGGAMHSHPDDPQVVGPAMARLVRGGYKFKIVGPPRGTRKAFQLDAEPITTGPVPIENYAHALTKLEVGIAPLKDTRFNAAKSWLKMLEYASLGVPCIGSPRDEYRRLHALGVGLLASSPKEWFRHGKALLDSIGLREEVAGRGREAAAKLTIEGNAWRWWEAWTKAYELQRSLPKDPEMTVATVPAEP